MRQNLDLETDKLDLLRIGEVPVCLMDDAGVDCLLNRFIGNFSLNRNLLLHLLDKFTLEDQKFSSGSVFE